MTAHSYLESFDDPSRAGPSEHPEFTKGFAAGSAETEHAAAQAKLRQIEAITSALQDAHFTFAEARSALLLDLKPLFEAISQQLFPAQIQSAMAGQIVNALHQMATSGVRDGLRIKVHSDHVETLTDILSQTAFTATIEQTDQRPLIAWVFDDQSSTMIDMTTLCQSIEATLAAISPTTEPKEKSQ